MLTETQIKTMNPYYKSQPAKLIGSITLEDAYFYKGSSNCSLTICTMDDGTIRVFSQYGELMTTCTSISGLVTFLSELMSDRYA